MVTVLDPAAARNRIRTMVAADKAPTLTDGEVDDLVAVAAVPDADGLPTGDGSWTPTYDLRRAAAEGWRWKASKVAHMTSFSADGASINKGDLLDHCERMVKMYGGKRLGSVGSRRRRDPLDVPVVGN